jgi:hypothetical protein
MLPVLVLRGRQLHAGLKRRDALRARKLGVTTHRVGVAALLAANLLVLS